MGRHTLLKFVHSPQLFKFTTGLAAGTEKKLACCACVHTSRHRNSNCRYTPTRFFATSKGACNQKDGNEVPGTTHFGFKTVPEEKKQEQGINPIISFQYYQLHKQLDILS